MNEEEKLRKKISREDLKHDLETILDYSSLKGMGRSLLYFSVSEQFLESTRTVELDSVKDGQRNLLMN